MSDGGLWPAPEPVLVIEAFRKIFRESPSFLITVPTGYNGVIDDYLFGARVPGPTTSMFGSWSVLTAATTGARK